MEQVIHLKLTDGQHDLIISNPDIEPLGLDDLIAFEKESTLKFKVHGIATEGPPEFKGVRVTADYILNTSHTNKCFALVSSGWLPPVFAIKDAILLADRNVINYISARFESGVIKASANPQADFIDLIADTNYNAKISLAPFALEGNLKRRPSETEIIAQLEEAYRKVSSALPKLEIIPISPELVEGIMGVLGDSEDYFQRRSDFLLSSFHLLGNTAGKARRIETWNKIATLADRANLPRTDFIVIVALSSVTANGSCNPARGILKPKPSYAITDTYNTLCDIQLLSMLMQVLHGFPTQKTSLLTRDIPMAKLWAGISPVTTRKGKDLVECSYNIHKALLPLDDWEKEEFSNLLVS